MVRPRSLGPAVLATLLLLGAAALVLGGVARAGDDGAAAGDAGAAWFARPASATILVVGNQRGTLRPCGCTEPQLGGLERLAAVVESARRRARDAFLGVSVGWTLSGRGEEEDVVKTALYRRALEVMGFDAALLGTPDLVEPAMARPFRADGLCSAPRRRATRRSRPTARSPRRRRSRRSWTSRSATSPCAR